MSVVEIGGNKIQLQEHPKVLIPSKYAIFLGEILVDYFKFGMRGLELGIGSGVLSILAGLKGVSVVGLDISEDAVQLTSENWKLNGLDTSSGDFRCSDIFSALHKEEQGLFDLIWCNPPSLPGIPPNRQDREDRYAYQLAGSEGRELLDAMICQGSHWLQWNGCMVLIATSRQGWQHTEQLMNQYWMQWDVLATKELPLFAIHNSFIELWQQQEQEDGEPRIFQQEGKWFQKLYFLRAIKR
jgi:methylase of polypeptide subunit release factors